MTEEADAAREMARALIAALRMNAGRSGATECLEQLRALDVYALQPLVAQRQPVFFKDAWDELLDVLIAEAAQP